MRLIDADEFMKKAIEERRFFIYHEDIIHGGFEVRTVYKDLIDVINEMPTIEIEPVKHGWWIDLEVENSTGKIFGCSVCNRTYNPNKEDVKNGRTKEKPNYCHNCGARMDGDQE